jgi:hypothetical protein
LISLQYRKEDQIGTNNLQRQTHTHMHIRNNSTTAYCKHTRTQRIGYPLYRITLLALSHERQKHDRNTSSLCMALILHPFAYLQTHIGNCAFHTQKCASHTITTATQYKTERNSAIQTAAHTKKRLTLSIATLHNQAVFVCVFLMPVH